MFLKTEQFEYNGVSVTLSELSALQRIEHLALLKRRAEQAESSGNLQVCGRWLCGRCRKSGADAAGGRH